MAKSSKNENTKKYAIDLSRVFFVCHIIVLFLFPFQLNAMVENDSMLVHDSAIVHDSAFTQDSTIVHDSTVVQNSSEEMPAVTTEEERPLWLEVLIWPFSNIIQPALSAAIYPVSTPLKYAFNNRVIDKAVNLISFGKDKNAFLYPTLIYILELVRIWVLFIVTAIFFLNQIILFLIFLYTLTVTGAPPYVIRKTNFLIPNCYLEQDYPLMLIEIALFIFQ